MLRTKLQNMWIIYEKMLLCKCKEQNGVIILKTSQMLKNKQCFNIFTLFLSWMLRKIGLNCRRKKLQCQKTDKLNVMMTKETQCWEKRLLKVLKNVQWGVGPLEIKWKWFQSFSEQQLKNSLFYIIKKCNCKKHNKDF